MIKTREDTNYLLLSSQEIAFIIQKCHDVEYGQQNKKNTLILQHNRQN